MHVADAGYDEQALEQLNWFLRDWRVNEPAKMDPRLFDILWEVYRGLRVTAINIVSAYRSPATNGMLRRRSSSVSEHSQHMLGKAMDIRLPDVETGRLRAIVACVWRRRLLLLVPVRSCGHRQRTGLASHVAGPTRPPFPGWEDASSPAKRQAPRPP